ncbi:transcriptional regulator, IclR family [Verrucomicrobium sp. GAS474]|uniref:IclR family transcriptional regulator n=1 Tax=Verrucomicrobium sp. GAS474 TaxID=1882831 RepID=UPI00087AC419|nr:IclR family transcriptional regulator [Verrucomicrobium sp. GAS474]SDT98912.1 transcriptional regulator, IclR family [Verrucomicrobium sp. GAS474]
MPRVLSLDKSLSVLEAIFHHHDGIGTRALAQQMQLNVATIHNIARTFCLRGYLRQDPETKVFYPGIRLMLLARHPTYLRSLTLSASGIVEETARKLNESVLLASMDHGRVLNLKYVPSRQALRAQESEDMSLHSYATAVGKILLAATTNPELDAFLQETKLQAFTPRTFSTVESLKAELRRVREEGRARTREEFCAGLNAGAVPIRDPWGSIVAAIGASAPTIRLETEEQWEALFADLSQAASAIEAQWREAQQTQPRKAARRGRGPAAKTAAKAAPESGPGTGDSDPA